MDRQTIENLLMPATYGRHLTRMFEPVALLAGTGLKPEDLNDPERRITVRQALQYIDNTLRLAVQPDWYLAWAGTLSDHFHGPISVALMSAPTLGAGVDTFLEFFPVRVPYLHLQGRVEHDLFFAGIWPLIELGAATPLLIETPLLILQRYIETMYATDFGAARLDLAYPPTAHAACYSQHFRCPVRFDAPRSTLVFPRSWREMRNLDYRESTWSHALGQCQALASSRERTTLGEIHRLLVRAFDLADRPRALPTLNEVAAQLHLAPRTLIRRLRAMGTTYQATTDDFLQRRAAELLGNDEVKIKEVAAALGFQNPANFGKAFKRWFGVSPGSFRARQGGGTAD